MSATYITLRVDDPAQADDLLRDLRDYPNDFILTPTLENTVGVVAVSVMRDGVPYWPPLERDE